VLDYDPKVRTRSLARIVGPYLIVTAAALFVRRDALPNFLSSFMQDEALVFVTGAFALMAGMATLMAHHHWSSFSAGVISFIGLAAALKGASLMIAPDLGEELTDAVTRTPFIFEGAIGLELLLGLWLSFVGWARDHVFFAFAVNR